MPSSQKQVTNPFFSNSAKDNWGMFRLFYDTFEQFTRILSMLSDSLWSTWSQHHLYPKNQITLYDLDSISLHWIGIWKPRSCIFVVKLYTVLGPTHTLEVELLPSLFSALVNVTGVAPSVMKYWTLLQPLGASRCRQLSQRSLVPSYIQGRFA